MKTLYIIHGWTYTVEPWTKTIEILRDKYKIEVKMLHVPGLTEQSQKVWTINDYVRWAKRELPDDAVVLGHSNGGRILMNLTIKHPKKLSYLILLDSAGIYEKSLKRDILRGLSKAFGIFKRVPILRKVFHKLVGASDYAHAPENMKKTLANMHESDKNLDPSRIKVKTSILWGENDQITPLRQGKKLHELINNSTFYSSDKWRHAPYIDDPKGLAKAINEVLA